MVRISAAAQRLKQTGGGKDTGIKADPLFPRKQVQSVADLVSHDGPRDEVRKRDIYISNGFEFVGTANDASLNAHVHNFTGKRLISMHATTLTSAFLASRMDDSPFT
ncbi:unnamed protein product [Mesocestoides corti]|uniref:Transcriptional regulator n=1 Tax=Mesocestoides corti TaxID=53468 RepID=A0A0R3UK27_MESCO|nr:unnamed protein product [Mesocestoides corti]